MFEVQQGKSDEFVIDEEGVLRLGTRLCVPDVDDLRKELLEEAHYSAYSVHLGFFQDVSYSKGYILVEWDEEGCCRICIEVSHMPTGEVRASETSRIASAIAYPRVEVGYDCYGFCDWFASYYWWI